MGKFQDRFDDWYRKKYGLTSENWDIFAEKYYPQAVKALSKLAHPIWGPIFRRMFRFVGKGHHAESAIVPINKDLTFKAKNKENFVMPIEKIREAVREASYRIILHKCLCRDSFKCKNYPIDIGCLMIGEACRHMVKSGIAREATLEESMAHLDRGAELGLVGICAWTEMESVGKGIPKEDQMKYIEICFCCPCCCNGLVNFKKWYKIPELHKLMTPTGWRAVATEDCTGCGSCTESCPMDALKVETDGTLSTHESCIGCGLCTNKCPQDALVMEQYELMKEHILDYFGDIRPQING